MSASVQKARRSDDNKGLRVLVLGATGTAGTATIKALVRAGHDVTCLVRKRSSQQHDTTINHNAHGTNNTKTTKTTNNTSKPQTIQTKQTKRTKQTKQTIRLPRTTLVIRATLTTQITQ